MTWLKRFAERPLTALGGLLASGSAAAIFGGWSDTAQAISRKLVGLPAVDVPLPLLVAMLVAGLDLVAFEQVYLVRRGATAGHRLLAIRHTSLNPSTVPHLRESELPKEGHTIQQRRLLHQQQAA